MPRLVDVHTDVIVNQHVSHSADSPPVERRQTRPSLSGNALGCLTNYLHVPNDGILQLIRLQERVSPRLNEAGDAVATFEDVMQIQASSFTEAWPRGGFCRARTSEATFQFLREL
jgi:hypothetical protein